MLKSSLRAKTHNDASLTSDYRYGHDWLDNHDDKTGLYKEKGQLANRYECCLMALDIYQDLNYYLGISKKSSEVRHDPTNPILHPGTLAAPTAANRVGMKPSFAILPGTEDMAEYGDYMYHLRESWPFIFVMALPSAVIALLTASRGPRRG